MTSLHSCLARYQRAHKYHFMGWTLLAWWLERSKSQSNFWMREILNFFNISLCSKWVKYWQFSNLSLSVNRSKYLLLFTNSERLENYQYFTHFEQSEILKISKLVLKSPWKQCLPQYIRKSSHGWLRKEGVNRVKECLLHHCTTLH